MAIDLPDLPYDSDALAPFMSKATLEFHHGKHHRAYVDKLAKLIDGTPYENRSAEDIAIRAHAAGDTAVFNNAAQALNHEIFWKSLTPNGGGRPGGPLDDAIEKQFGGLDQLKKEFRFSALTHFGSGWTWLVSDDGRLRILSTPNADTPIVHGMQPLLALDVWEHAYYLDFQNDRDAYVDTYLNELADWSFAEERFAAVRRAA